MNRHSPLFVTSLLVTGISQAQAQPLEEVIVTADFRSATVQDIAASVSVLDAALMKRKNAQHLEDILLNAPNVNMAAGASRARFYQLRGIGERGQFAEPLNSSVGLLIDGVDFSGIATSGLLYDIEKVEILMGPQGTRYGSNALAGLINVSSRKPGTTLEYGMQLQLENYAGEGVSAYLSSPLTDTLQIRLAGQQLKSDGYIYNQYLNRPTNTRDESSLRGSLHWDASPTLSVDLTLAGFSSANGYDAFSLDNNRTTHSDNPGIDAQNTQLGSLRIQDTHFDSVTLEAYLGVARTESDYGYDEDWTYSGFHPWEYSSTDDYQRHHDTASAELRLLSTDSSALFGGRTQWVTGIYALRQNTDLTRLYTYLPGPFQSEYSNRRLAVYADTTTEISPRWSLEAGLRGERFTADYRDNEAVSFNPQDNLAGGKLALRFQLDDDSLLYVSAAKGYKTGGFNTDGTLDADLREFATEFLWNYEAGYKATMLDSNLQFQAALFWMNRKDVQISSSTVRVRADGSAEFIDYTGNAAQGMNRGLELSFQWQASGTLRGYGSVGLLDTSYENFINSAGQNLSGRDQAHAPRYQYSAGINWLLLPALTLTVEAQGRDKFYFSDSHAASSASYTLLNTNLNYQWQQWSLSIWGRNLGDSEYAVRGYYFGNDPRDGYTDRAWVQLGEPRRFGVTINLDF